MRQRKTKALLSAALAGILAFAPACQGGSSDASEKIRAEGTDSAEHPGNLPVGSEDAGSDSGKKEETATYTDTYDADAMFKFGMTPVKDSETGKYGYKNEAGEWVIEPQFTMALEFQINKTAFVRTGANSDEYRLIDRDGAFVSDYIFTVCYGARELAFASNGIAAGTWCQPDGTEIGKGYFYLNGETLEVVPREEEEVGPFSDDGYAVLDRCAIIDETFSYTLAPQEEFDLTKVSNGLASVSLPKSEYGYIDVNGNLVIRGLSESGGLFADNGLAAVGNQLIDRSGNVVFDVADTHYSILTGDFNDSDWAEVSSHGANRGGTDFNFVNASGECFLPADAYEHSHMDGKLAIRQGIYVGPAPVIKDEDGEITAIGAGEDYAKVAVNEDMEILYILAEKGLTEVEAYCSDGYAYAETNEEERVIVDMEGNIVMER